MTMNHTGTITFEFPKVMVPVWFIVIAFFVFGSKKGQSSYQAGVIRRGGEVMRAEEKAAGVASIVEHDPNFNEGDFDRRVGVAFHKIQSAWCQQDLTSVRPFISDGIYERFQLQFDEQRALGYRDHMENIRCDSVKIAAVTSKGLFDEVSVRIEAAAKDYRESIADGRRISGSTSVEPFVEIWTFLRRREAVTSPSRAPGLIEGNCPNCGAAVEMNQSANCTHCKALLRSGEYDWVLAEITQEVEWQVPKRGGLPGAKTLCERDPGFDPAALEDRASVVFWRKATADRLGKIDPLRKMALDSFCDQYAGALRGNQGRTFIGDCAVGSVDMRGVMSDGQWDRAIVELRYSGKRFVIDTHGPRNTGEDFWAAVLFVLAKKAESPTDAAQSISSAHCPNCGAPESNSADAACQFCGTVLNDGAQGWVLEQVLGRDDSAGQALLADLRRPPAIPGTAGADAGDGNWHRPEASVPDSMGLLAWMVKVATADGNVDPREREQLVNFATGWNVPLDRVDGMIAAGLRGDLAVPKPHDSHEARAWLEAMATEAWADGKVTREELELLKSVAVPAGLGDYDVDQIVKSARAKLYQESAAALRARRGK
jgi:hypothetical protein